MRMDVAVGRVDGFVTAGGGGAFWVVFPVLDNPDWAPARAEDPRRRGSDAPLEVRITCRELVPFAVASAAFASRWRGLRRVARPLLRRARLAEGGRA